MKVRVTSSVSSYMYISDISFVDLRVRDHEAFTYRIEGNIGGGKLWRIWQMTINSPKFQSPIFAPAYACSHV